MAQYLLNVTAIWLLSLLIFDLLLKKESYHSYNRLYLVTTLLCGIFLPLIHWQDPTVIYGQNNTVQKVVETKARIADNASISHIHISWQHALLYLYITGAALSLLFFIAELVKLITLYKKGRKSTEGAWTIIETAGDHAPFSIFNFTFVASKAQYTPEQWNIVLTHEQLHSMAFHFVDLLLIQIVRIFFWFHPLVYIYQRRLLMLHEYQADRVSAVQPRLYGQFLVEQAMLSKAPAVSHSFSFSPVRSRIGMLSKKSSAIAKGKLLLAIPLTLVCLLLFTQNSFSAKFSRDGNIVKYRDNVIELSPQLPADTVTVMDPSTGKQQMLVTSLSPHPIKLNGKKIYTSDDLYAQNKMGSPVTNTSSFTADGLREYLLSRLSGDFSKLEDGYYMLSVDNVVVNENGSIVYYEYGSLRGTSNSYPPKPHAEVDKATSEAIGRRVDELLNEAPKHEPAYYKGDAVPSLVNGVVSRNPFQIKNHKLVSM